MTQFEYILLGSALFIGIGVQVLRIRGRRRRNYREIIEPLLDKAEWKPELR